MDYVDDQGRPAHTLGVIGALGLEPPGEGILPHEHTTPKAKSDRLDLMRATRAKLSAVWVLSLTSGLSDLLGDLGEPRSVWTDGEAVTHTVWKVDDPERVASISASVAATPVVVSYLLARAYDPNVFSAASLITAALIGCCAGFLPHNFNPARIFMGDSGSMLLGLLLAAATISLTGNVDPANVPQLRLASYVPILLPVAVLLLPSLDLVLAVVRRSRAGQKWSQPDTLHLHHRLLAIGHSHAHAVLIMYLWTAVLTLGAASFAFVPAREAIAGIAAAGGLAAVLTLGLPRMLRQRRGAHH